MEHKKAKWSGDASGLNEKTLSLLFDYQRFEHEPELEALLDEAENEYCAERLLCRAGGPTKAGRRTGRRFVTALHAARRIF